MSTALHATALAVGEDGVLLRGPSGAGKSALALALLEEAQLQGLHAALVGDDRVLADVHSGRLAIRPHPAIAGQIERRGCGIERMAWQSAMVATLAVELVPGRPAIHRYPEAGQLEVRIETVLLPRLPLPAGACIGDGVRAILARLRQRR